MAGSLLGPRIREQRKAAGMTQAGLALAVGISPSYLNLIEAGRRAIGGALLKRIADRLGLPVDELDGAAQRRLVADLAELSGDAFLAGLHLDSESAGELAGRHPGWAAALVKIHRSWLDRTETVNALSDRLNQDPFLGDAVHSLLSRIAAIRSSAEILDGAEELPPAQRARFTAIVRSESGRLADVAQSLATYFDKANSSTQARSNTPADEVDDFLFDHDYHFGALEQAAVEFRTAVGVRDGCSEQALERYLRRAHSVQVKPCAAAGQGPGELPRSGRFDLADRTLHILDTAPSATRRFLLAALASQLFHQGQAVAAELENAPLLTTEAARSRAARALTSYVAAAVLMPYDAFLQSAVQCGYDIDVLARAFGVSIEQACHRLVSLRRRGAEGIPFGMMRAGPSGHVTKRFPLPHLPLPRYGHACSLWAVHEAGRVSSSVVRQLVEFPTGHRFLFLARTIERPRPDFSMPRRFTSIMLACDALYGDRTVYGRGLDLASSAPAVPVGPGCRVCARRDCAYREEEAFIEA